MQGEKMNIVMMIGDRPDHHFLAHLIKTHFSEQNVQIVVQQTFSSRYFYTQIKRRSKKYGIFKVFDELLYKLLEIFIQQSNKIYQAYFHQYLTRQSEPVITVRDPNDEAVKYLIEEIRPDVLVTSGVGILKAEIFQKAKKSINLHPGLTPKYRGYGSFWALYNQDYDSVGYTIHYIDAGIDTGQVIMQKKMDVRYEDRILPHLNSHLALAAGSSLVQIIHSFYNGENPEDNHLKSLPDQVYTLPGLTDYIRMRFCFTKHYQKSETNNVV